MRVRSLVVLLVGASVLIAGPAPAQDSAVPHVLVWGGTYGFRHPSITQAYLAFEQLAAETGAFTVEITENPADLSATKLAGVDVLTWVSSTGKPPITDAQRDAVIRHAACGGGTLAFHAAADSNYGWAEYAELLGAQFDSHPKNVNSGEARMLVEDNTHPITAGWAGETEFMLDDEYYRWRSARGMPGISLPRDLPGTAVLLSLDETTVGEEIQSGPLAYEHHQPIAWTKTFRGGGRVYYNNMGHSEATWSVSEFRTSIVNGIGWVSEVPLDLACFEGDEPLPPPALPPAADLATVGRTCTVPDLGERAGGTWETSGPAKALTEAGDAMQLPSAGIPGGLGWGAQTYVLDVSASRAPTADITIDLTIPVPADDYDLSVTTGWGWYGSHAMAGATTEQVVMTDVPHCTVFHVAGDNMAALSRQAPSLEVSVTPAEPLVATLTRLTAASPEPVDVAVAWSADRDAPVCGCAVLARDDDPADALASGAMQGATGAPLLLTDPAALSDATRAELQRLAVTEVTILGGEAAVTEAVADELRALGITVERVFGPSRIETAIELARTLPTDAEPLVVRAYGTAGDPTAGFADSLAAGREAARSTVRSGHAGSTVRSGHAGSTVRSGHAGRVRPVLLTDSAALSPALASYLEEAGTTRAAVIGGTAAVSDEVVADLEARGIAVTRVAGDERAATAAAVATELGGAASASAAPGVVLIDGASPAAWAEGFPAAGYDRPGPLLLTAGDALPAATAAWLGGEAAGMVPLTCGPLVTTAACDAAAAHLGLSS